MFLLCCVGWDGGGGVEERKRVRGASCCVCDGASTVYLDDLRKLNETYLGTGMLISEGAVVL